MILTGKAKEDFLKWVALNRNILADYHENHVISDMVDWLDSVGIYINIRCFEDRCISFITSDSSQFFEINREEAYKQAIIKANEIYNNLNK